MFAPFTSSGELIAFSEKTIEMRTRQAEMLLTLMEFEPRQSLPEGGYLDSLETMLISRGDKDIRRMLGSTYFGMWLETFGRWVQSHPDSNLILPPPLELNALDLLARRFSLRERDVPPFMRLLIPPSHTFRQEYQPGHPSEIKEYSWERALQAAIANAGIIMPDLNQVIETFATHFLILEDVGFRSCSADRYLGLILLSTSDQTLIDIEETVIHEVGHQVLYQLDRDRNLFHSHDDEYDVVLPWSGSLRNYFGFFHAAYIYLVLRDYYVQAAQKHPFDRPYCTERLATIQAGLNSSISLLLEGQSLLTPSGQDLCNTMIQNIKNSSVISAESVA